MRFFNTTEIAERLDKSNKVIISHADKLGLKPVGRIENKPSSHKSGHVWRAKEYRKLKRYFNKLAV